MKIIGYVLIAIGVIALTVGGISYTHKEKVLDIGPIQATTEKHETIPLPPVLGVISLVGGIVMVVAASKKP